MDGSSVTSDFLESDDLNDKSAQKDEKQNNMSLGQLTQKITSIMAPITNSKDNEANISQKAQEGDTNENPAENKSKKNSNEEQNEQTHIVEEQSMKDQKDQNPVKEEDTETKKSDNDSNPPNTENSQPNLEQNSPPNVPNTESESITPINTESETNINTDTSKNDDSEITVGEISQDSPAQLNSDQDQGTPEHEEEDDHEKTFVTTRNNVHLKDPSMRYSLPPIQTAPPKEDVDRYLSALLENHTMPPEDVRQYVNFEINRRKTEALMNRDYDKAKEFDKAILYISRTEQDGAFKGKEEEKRLELKVHQERLLKHFNKVSDSFDTKIGHQKSTFDEQYKDLEEKHRRERQDFRQKWQSIEFLQKFNKPSARLLQLRHIEKKQAISKMYEEAKQTRSQADALQAQEEEHMQLTIQIEMKKDYTKLKERQLREKTALQTRKDIILGNLEIKKDHELDVINKAMSKVSIDMKGNENLSEASTIRTRCASSYSKARESYADSSFLNSSTTSTIPTPRTQLKYKNYKISRDAGLNLYPVDNSTYKKITRNVNHERARSSGASPKKRTIVVSPNNNNNNSEM